MISRGFNHRSNPCLQLQSLTTTPPLLRWKLESHASAIGSLGLTTLTRACRGERTTLRVLGLQPTRRWPPKAFT
jgi:hypothetical protein